MKHGLSASADTNSLSAGVGWVRQRLECMAEERAAAGRLPPAAPPLRPELAGLAALASRFELTRFEQDTLLLCAAAALDLMVPALCAAAHGDASKPYPTFALASRLFDDPDWKALTPAGALRQWQLVEIHPRPHEAIFTAALRLDDHILDRLQGLTEIDERVAGWTEPLHSVRAGGLLPTTYREVAGRMLAILKQERLSQSDAVVQLVGLGTECKHEAASFAAEALGLSLRRFAAANIALLGSESDTFAQLLGREARLSDIALFVDAEDLPASGDHAQLFRMLRRLKSMVVFLTVKEPLVGVPGEMVTIAADKPTPDEQRAAWQAVLRQKNEQSAKLLAGQFNLDIRTIQRVGHLAGQAADGDARELFRHTARDALRPMTGGLAERIETKATWDDLVLPSPQLSLLRQIVDQAKHQWKVYQDWAYARRLNRGLGIAALFCGESGTGKTMAAEVIAGEVGLHLYRIDLASVVSKYIGETEKNLRRLFDAFDNGGAILFFDEADALFGKRSEVKDSHDRYANIEVNYLLQRIEAYRGLAILATNRRSALDQAFLRRLRFVVNIPYPGVKERTSLWRKAFPAEVNTAELDFERLARLGLSGGNIQTVALNAAFRAAALNREVGMDLILAAARDEMIKLEMSVTNADFVWPVGEVKRA